MIFCLIFLTCEKDIILNPQYSSAYFPSAEGNSWTYYNPYFSEETLTYKILDEMHLNKKEYILYGQKIQWADTLRVDKLGIVHIISQGKEMVWLDVTRLHGSVYFCDGKPVHVKRNVEITTKAGNFKNCIDFFFDFPNSMDDEVGYILAAKVGIVKIYGAWTHLELYSYQIVP